MWTVFRDKSTKSSYYYNNKSGISQWEDPRAAAATRGKAAKSASRPRVRFDTNPMLYGRLHTPAVWHRTSWSAHALCKPGGLCNRAHESPTTYVHGWRGRPRACAAGASRKCHNDVLITQIKNLLNRK